jgi:acetyltransferase-like isoleucine patch superfamily enzyme
MVSMRDSDGHAVEAEARKRGDPPDIESVRPIVIEDNVWVGAGSVIGPGVTLGEGSVVAARSVVQSSVAPYTIVAGNPARRVGIVPRAEDVVGTNARESVAVA